MFGKSSMASVEMTSSKVLSINSLLSYEQWSVNSRSVFSLQKILVCILLGTFPVSFSRKGTGECVTVPCRVCMNITYYHVLKPSWCHCHTLSLASVKYRLVLPFWYRLTWVVRDKGPLNGCVCAAHYKIFLIFRATCPRVPWGAPAFDDGMFVTSDLQISDPFILSLLGCLLPSLSLFCVISAESDK